MPSVLTLISLYLTVVSVHSKPINQFASGSDLKTERSWLWGWAWGAENRVSIVDRSPALSFSSRPAAFGAELKDPLLGYVIPLSSFAVPCVGNTSFAEPPPNLGCPSLCVHGPNEPERGDTWIALVQRGDCEFVSKVREAQRLGANAVVVGGDNPDTSGNPDVLVNMYSPGDASDVKIAATYIIYSDYKLLFSLISASNTTHSGLRTLSLLITAEYSAWEWYSPIVTFIIILLLPSSLTFITLLVHRVRASRAAQRDRAPEDFVNTLPSRVWTGKAWEKLGGEELATITASDADEATDEDPSTSQVGMTSGEHPWFEQQAECAICLSEFIKGDRVRILPCQHMFHLDEVDEWLIQRKKWCPVCKADVTQPLQPTHAPTPSSTDETETNGTESRSSEATERTPLLSDTT